MGLIGRGKKNRRRALLGQERIACRPGDNGETGVTAQHPLPLCGDGTRLDAAVGRQAAADTNRGREGAALSRSSEPLGVPRTYLGAGGRRGPERAARPTRPRRGPDTLRPGSASRS